MYIVKEYKKKVQQVTLGFKEIEIEPISYSYIVDKSSFTIDKKGRKHYKKIPRIRTFIHIYVDTSSMNDLTKALGIIPLKADLGIWKIGNGFYWQYGRKPIVVIRGSKNPKFYTQRRFIDKRFSEARRYKNPRKACNTQAQICLTMLKRVGYASCKWCG